MTAIGVDIGGTKMAAGLVTSTGEIIDARTAPTPLNGAEAILDTLTALCRSLQSKAASQGLDVNTVGIGTAGQVDHVRGSIVYANENLPGWTGTPVVERMSAALGLPVYVENDVKAMAMGESRFGAGRGFQHILYLAVGTGIGGAVVLNGELWRGANGTAGEFGYLVAGWDGDRPIKVEEMLAGPGLAARYDLLSGERLSLNQIAQRAADGDTLAAQVIRDGAQRLGIITRPVLTFLDPQVLIVGGGVPGIGALWWDAFVEPLRQFAVLPAQLGINTTLIGAAWIALDNLARSD